MGDKSLALVAITHERASLDVLESVNLNAEMSVSIARELVSSPGTAEAVVVSTCNRTELYLYGEAPNTLEAMRALGALCDLPLESIAECAVRTGATAAVRHLLRVAAGLDSRLVGEVEVLGQIRAAIARATSSGTAGANLTSVFGFAVAAGRQAQRTGDRTLVPSLPRLALDTALPTRPGLTIVLGSGAIARGTTNELRARRLEYRVCARRAERAACLARSANDVIPFEQLAAALHLPDVVVCATGARSPLLRAADLERAVRQRDGHELTVVDLCVPRNVEPAARGVAGVRMFDLDDLVAHSSALLNRSREQIVAEQLRRYESWLAGRTVGHLIAQLRDLVETECHERLALPPHADPHGDVRASAARTMAAKSLHGPMVTIKDFIAS